MKNVLCAMLAVLMGLAAFAGFVPQTAEAAVQANDYNVTGAYAQTSARSMTEWINDFRTGGDAWYWNSDNETKTVFAAGELGLLTYDYALERIAMQRAAELVINFDHTRPTGESCFTCTYEGVQSYGENIAFGYGTAEAVYLGWREDDQPYDYQGHRRNMLRSGYTAIGVACFTYDGDNYWVQEFGYDHSGMQLPDPFDGTTTVKVATGTGEPEEFIPPITMCDVYSGGSCITETEPGTEASIWVSVEGEAAAHGLTYQWVCREGDDGEWQDIPDATEDTYTFIIRPEHEGMQFCCRIGNPVSEILSYVYEVTFSASAVYFTKQPEPATAYEGETVTFTVGTHGDDLIYQWYCCRPEEDGMYSVSPVDGADGDTCTVIAAAENNGCSYYCVINRNGSCRSFSSDRALLTVIPIKPVITTQPKNKTVALGKTVKLTVKAEGSEGETLKYQWYYRTKASGSWKKITTAYGTKATLKFTAKAKHHGWQYRCLVRGSKGKIYTKTVTVSIKYGPKITTQPENKSTLPDKKVKLKVEATGRSIRYQWYYRTSSKASWKKVSSASGTKATYTFTATAKKNGWQFRCKLSSKYGAVYTKTVKLTVSKASYRALLIGEVNFDWDTATRNQGDVEHMKAMLASIKGPNGGKYQTATRLDLGYSEVESAIKKTFADTKDTDASLFFIATHGNSYGDGELALTDGTDLDFGTLAGWLSKYVKGDIIVFIESCGAGSAIYQNGAAFDPDVFMQKAVDAFAAVEEQEANAGVGAMRRSRFYVLAAAAHHEESWGYEGDTPQESGNLFTDWLIEGIGSSGSMPADTDSNKIVTLKELYQHIRQYDDYGYQHVQAYPKTSTYKLFKRN